MLRARPRGTEDQSLKPRTPKSRASCVFTHHALLAYRYPLAHEGHHAVRVDHKARLLFLSQRQAKTLLILYIIMII